MRAELKREKAPLIRRLPLLPGPDVEERGLDRVRLLRGGSKRSHHCSVSEVEAGFSLMWDLHFLFICLICAEASVSLQ